MSTNRNWRILSSDMVLSKNPCDHYRELLITRYLLRPIEVTVGLAVQQAEDWDWYWAGENLLEDYGKFLRAVDELAVEYRDIQSRLRKLAEDSHGPATNRRDAEFAKLRDGGMDYWDAMYAADKVYDEQMKYVRAARNAVNELIGKERNKGMARLFAEQFIAEGNESSADESEDDSVCNCEGCTSYRDEYENNED